MYKSTWTKDGTRVFGSLLAKLFKGKSEITPP